MFRKITHSVLYASLTTIVYFIAANIGYYYYNRRSMFADIYYYEWLEYVIVAVIILVCSVIIELVRDLKKDKG